MAYSPPNTFSDGTLAQSAEVEANNDALRVYLHRGIVNADLEQSKWVDTRHIQPPDYDAFTGVQHGVTGHQGAQWAGGESIRLTFATKYLSGNGRGASTVFHHLSNTAFTLSIRRDAKVLYHFWWDLENGRDKSTAPFQVGIEQRRVYITPWVSDLEDAYNRRYMAQETRNQGTDFSTVAPYGQTQTYPQGAGYGSQQGTLMYEYNNIGTVRVGLACHSLTDRCGIVNWGVAIEAYYL